MPFVLIALVYLEVNSMKTNAKYIKEAAKQKGVNLLTYLKKFINFKKTKTRLQLDKTSEVPQLTIHLGELGEAHSE